VRVAEKGKGTCFQKDSCRKHGGVTGSRSSKQKKDYILSGVVQYQRELKRTRCKECAKKKSACAGGGERSEGDPIGGKRVAKCKTKGKKKSLPEGLYEARARERDLFL